jgi:predicted choloylglycine hydrolase
MTIPICSPAMPAAAQSLPIPTTFFAIREEQPGAQWKGLFDATWPAYRAWYLQGGEGARPSFQAAEARLRRHMPELVPTWERLVELANGDETAARMLTLWNPPAFLPACSQAVLPADPPLLVRNYDYHPDLCERVVYSSAFTGRRVLGMSDCLWGLLDGMNDAGLAMSLAFGGRPGAGDGFAIPLVVRYLLETAESVAEVGERLSGLPVGMAYNLTAVDRNGEAGTFFVAPGERAARMADAVATNHRGRTPEVPAHAERFRSVERQQRLLAVVADGTGPESFVDEFGSPPLYSTAYAEAFGTLYTAVYRPADGTADFVWPGTRWRRTFDSPSGTHAVVLGGPRHGGGGSHAGPR